jgi:hypothetical protein
MLHLFFHRGSLTPGTQQDHFKQVGKGAAHGQGIFSNRPGGSQDGNAFSHVAKPNKVFPKRQKKPASRASDQKQQPIQSSLFQPIVGKEESFLPWDIVTKSILSDNDFGFHGILALEMMLL